MIVDSMTYDEVISEFKKDWRIYFPDVLPKYMNDNKYRRYMLKEAKDNVPVFFKPIELTSDRGNKYILQIESKGRSDYKRKGFLFTVYMYYHRSEGIYAVMSAANGSRTTKDDYYYIYTPHFFDRYRERELKDIHIPKYQTILDFFKHNATGRCMGVNNDKYKNSIFYAVPTGVLLGSVYKESVYEFRTYLTFDMLKNEQVDNAGFLLDLVKEFMDERQ